MADLRTDTPSQDSLCVRAATARPNRGTAKEVGVRKQATWGHSSREVYGHLSKLDLKVNVCTEILSKFPPEQNRMDHGYR